MKPRPGLRLQIVLTVLGYLPVAWWIAGFIHQPPTRLLARLLDFEVLRPEHIVVPLLVGIVLMGIPKAAGWLSRPGRLRLPGRGAAPIRPAGKIALTVAAVVLLWTVAEITVRLVDQVNGRGGPAAHYGPGPDLSNFHRWLQEAPTPGTLNVNAERFRGPDITEAKPAGALRLFTLGGPSTFLADLPYEQTYPVLVGSRLAKDRPAWTFEVYNAAYKTWTSQHALIWYMGRVQDFDPDVVTMMEGPTDLVYAFYNPETSRKPFDRAYGHNYGPLAFMVKARYVPGGKLPVWDHSRAYWYAHQWLRFTVHGPAGRGADNLAVFPKETQPPGPYPSLWCFERNLRTLGTLLRLQKRRLVLMTHPHCNTDDAAGLKAIQTRFGAMFHFVDERPVDAPTFNAGMRAMNDATRRLAAELNVPLVDLDRALSGKSEYFSDPWTLSARGCEAAAPQIEQVLLTVIPDRPTATQTRAAP